MIHRQSNLFIQIKLVITVQNHITYKDSFEVRQSLDSFQLKMSDCWWLPQPSASKVNFLYLCTKFCLHLTAGTSSYLIESDKLLPKVIFQVKRMEWRSRRSYSDSVSSLRSFSIIQLNTLTFQGQIQRQFKCVKHSISLLKQWETGPIVYFFGIFVFSRSVRFPWLFSVSTGNWNRDGLLQHSCLWSSLFDRSTIMPPPK